MHSKYRKLLDPLFAPKRMDEQEDDITRRVNGFIDAFIDRGECNFTEEFAELFPSSVFLGLMGLPEDELRMFLDLRDGILHPEKHDPDALLDIDARTAVMNATGEQIYEYFGNLVDERTAAAGRRHHHPLRRRRDRRRASSPATTSSTSASCSSSPASTP